MQRENKKCLNNATKENTIKKYSKPIKHYILHVDICATMSQPHPYSKTSTNKFLKSSSSSSSSSSDVHKRSESTNSFLGRGNDAHNLFTVGDRAGVVEEQSDVKVKVKVEDKVEVEEFPALRGSSTASRPVTGKDTLLYKTALLTKINHSHIEEQARIQKALRREMEAKEKRLKQMESASMRDRFVADAIHDCGSMAYDDDPVTTRYSHNDDD
jgi:hypothetical protein